jgi:hypothetical protein
MTLSERDISSKIFRRKSKFPQKSCDNRSVEKCWRRKAPYSEGEADMKSHNCFTHCKMRGEWIEKCWNLHPELPHTPNKKLVSEPM